MINRIEITIIPHESQRYDTCGDWQFKGDTLEIHVSDLGDERFNTLVVVHELIEAMECKFNGISEESVDEYDFKHKDAGSADLDSNLDAPYYRYHNDSTAIEWLLSRLFEVNWKDYSEKINQVSEEK
jgi:hypothetical protein